MIDHEAFMTAVLAAPDDDAPRLMYADWLEENGDSTRAEFIRVQIELARGEAIEPRSTVLRAREKELLNTHQDAWLAPIIGRVLSQRPNAPSRARIVDDFSRIVGEMFNVVGQATLSTEGFRLDDERLMGIPQQMMQLPEAMESDPHQIEYRFRRGFVDGIRLSPSNWVHSGAVILELAPIREVDLTLGQFGLGNNEAFQLPQLNSISRLRLSGMFSGVAALSLSESSQLAALDQLDLHAVHGVDEGIDSILEASNMPRLRVLNLNGVPLSREQVGILAANPSWKSLEQLELAGTRMGRDKLAALAASPHLQDLQRLNLSENGLKPDELEPILQDRFPHLVNLNLRFNDLEHSVVGGLAAWGRGVLTGRAISGWVEDFLSSPLSRRLKRVDLTGNRLTQDDQAAFRLRYGDGFTYMSSRRR